MRLPCSLINNCLRSGVVPLSFSDGTIVPILKKKNLNPDLLDHYRPITLTNTASKLLELVLLDEIQSQFIPHELQFGFVENRSTYAAHFSPGS